MLESAFSMDKGARMRALDMLGLLKIAEESLPDMLADGARWKSLWVDYHEPFVERLWTNADLDGVSCRVFLHKIHPAGAKGCLFHPHPWPSAMRVLGRYEMSMGFGSGMDEPPVFTRLILGDGDVYEMSHPDGWHAVAPIGEPSHSLMVAGPSWQREAHKPTHALTELEPEKAQALMEFFKKRYPAVKKESP